MVEWKKLGEIGDVCMCKRIMKHQTFDKGDVPFYKIGTFGGTADSFISKDLFYEYKSKFSFPQKGYILLSASGTIGRTVVYNGEDAYFQDSNIVWISNDESQVTNAFLYYCYQIVDWKIDGGTIKRLYNYNLKNTIIPVPSLSEQKRIVGILDTFTDSIENLKQQIDQRRKQYEHYRDQLLDLEGKEGVEMTKLDTLCNLITKQTGFDYSKTIKPSLTKEKNIHSIPFIQNKDFEGTRINLNTDFYIPLSIAQKFPKILLNDKILLVSISGRIGNVGLYDIKDISFVGGAVCVCRLNPTVNGRYILYFLLSNKGQNRLFQSVKAASHSNITVEDIRKISIPFPPLSEQQRIVSILDTFEASISNLEAQLEQRQKQYEYYRNKLLTFEKEEQ